MNQAKHPAEPVSGLAQRKNGIESKRMISPATNASQPRIRLLKNKIRRGHPRTFAGNRAYFLVTGVLFVLLVTAYIMILWLS